MKSLQVSDCIMDMDRKGNTLPETEFCKVPPGGFFIYLDETFMKSIGDSCVSMEDYSIYTLLDSAKVKTIFSISFD